MSGSAPFASMEVAVLEEQAAATAAVGSVADVDVGFDVGFVAGAAAGAAY